MNDDPDITIYELPSPGALRRAAMRSYLAQRRVLPPRKIGAGLLAAAVSVLLHVMLVGSLWWSGAAHRWPVPIRQGAGANASDATGEPVMTVIFFNSPDAVQTADSEPPLASRGVVPMNPLVSILSPDVLPAVEANFADARIEDAAVEPETAAEQRARAVMLGRYRGQITARVERAWLRPRTSVGDGSFTCRVRIVQDRHGAVQETTLERCNGDVHWQQSLVQAIQSASPLPAPPDPSVFADSMTLAFQASAWKEGNTADGYEPPVRVAQVTPTTGTPTSSWTRTPTGVMDLRITGRDPRP